MGAPWREEWTEYAKTLGEPPAFPEDPEGMKNFFNAFMVSAVPQLPPSDPAIQTRDIDIPGVCKARIYTPRPIAGGEPLSLVLFIHGGGFFAGNLDTEDYTCRSICSGVPAIVLSVEYSTGWSLPIKHSVEDCYNAFHWALDQTSSLEADPSKFVVCGGSAGAAIATATVYRLIQTGHGASIAGLVSMNGLHVHPDATPEKYRHLMRSYEENRGTLPFVSGHHTLLRYEALNLVPPYTKTEDFEMFPAAAGAEYMRGFPRTIILTSENDASRDDGKVFEAELKDAGVEVRSYDFKGLAHYFWHFPLKGAGKEFRKRLVEGVRWTVKEK